MKHFLSIAHGVGFIRPALGAVPSPEEVAPARGWRVEVGKEPAALGGGGLTGLLGIPHLCLFVANIATNTMHSGRFAGKSGFLAVFFGCVVIFLAFFGFFPLIWPNLG